MQCECSDAISPNISSLSLEVKSRGEDGAFSRNSGIEITEVSLLVQCYFTVRLCFNLINWRRWNRRARDDREMALELPASIFVNERALLKTECSIRMTDSMIAGHFLNGSAPEGSQLHSWK